MSEELFSNLPAVKSPRLKWIEKHNLIVWRDVDWCPGDEDEFGFELYPWYARSGGGKRYGASTEDAAMIAWAKANSVKSWTEEG